MATTDDSYRPPARLRYVPAVSAGATGLLEETIIPTPDSVELYRTPTTDYISRLVSRTPHVAELFHCNSRITRCSDANTVLDADAFAVAREWFYTTALKPDGDVYDRDRATRDGVLDSVAALAARAGEGLAWLESAEANALAYALDVLVLDGDRIWRLMPGFPEAWLERTATPRELAALPELLPELDVVQSTLLVFIAAAPWRYMLLQGPRGYRRTLIDAGSLTAGLLAAGRATGTAMRASVDFLDLELDRLLRLDGVERSVVVTIAFGPAAETEAAK